MWNQGLIDTTVIIDTDGQLLWAVVDKIVKVFYFLFALSGIVWYSITMKLLNNISMADMLRLIMLAYISLC